VTEAPPTPHLAAVLVSWNQRADLARCLDSLAAEAERGAPRTVVVSDNGSTDGSLEVARAGPDVLVVANGRNLGFAEATNRGIERALAAGAEQVLLLNTDAHVPERWRGSLARLAAALAADPTVGAAAPVIYDEAGRVWFSGGDLDPARLRVAHREDAPAGVRETPFLTGCALAVRREVLEQTGGLDPDYWAYFEDLDLSLRIRAAGWRLVVVPAAGVVHRGGGAIGRGARYGYYLGRGRILFLAKHPEACPGRLRPLLYWWGSAAKRALTDPDAGGLRQRLGLLAGAAAGPVAGLAWWARYPGAPR